MALNERIPPPRASGTAGPEYWEEMKVVLIAMLQKRLYLKAQLGNHLPLATREFAKVCLPADETTPLSIS